MFADLLEGANQYGSHQWQPSMGSDACDCGNAPAHTIQQHEAMRKSMPMTKQNATD